MRLRYAPVLLLLLATRVLAAQRPTTLPSTAPTENKMTYVLGNDNNENLAKNPTTERIRAAVASLDGDKVNAIYIHKDEAHCIQVNWESDKSFSFQYVDGGDDHLYATKKKYPPDAAVALLLSYMSGHDEWLKMVDWAPMK